MSNTIYSIELTGQEMQELLIVLDNIDIEETYQFFKQKDELIPIAKSAIDKIWNGAIAHDLISEDLKWRHSIGTV